MTGNFQVSVPVSVTSLLKQQPKHLTPPEKTRPARHCTMSGLKRDWNGNAKRRDGPRQSQKQAVRNAYTPMFEKLRDELDEHYDRRERIVKASRDVTALSKKM